MPNPLIPSQEAREALIEQMAVALSMADPDERGLPENEQMAPFYRKLARVALDVAEPAIRKDEAEQCARVTDSLGKRLWEGVAPGGKYVCDDIATALRARHAGESEDGI